MSPTQLILLALIGFACPACDRPCETYWRRVCADCGEASGACARAKELSSAILGDEGACADATRTLGATPMDERAQLCGRPTAERFEPNLAALTQGAFVCDGLRLEFDSNYVSIGDERFETYDFRAARFSVKMTPQHMQECQYHLGPHARSAGEVGLWIDCVVPVGALSNAPTLCVREAIDDHTPIE